MEKINLSTEELKKFFEKYTFLELMNYKGLFEYALDYDLDEAIELLDQEADRKMYDQDAQNFNRSYKLKQLSDEELQFVSDIAESADTCFSNVENMNFENERRVTCRLLDIIEQEKDRRASLMETELMTLFRKYDICDLLQIKKILDPVYGIDIKLIENAFNKVVEEKYGVCANEFAVPVTPQFYTLHHVMAKNQMLTNKELEFLKKLVKSHFDGMLASGEECSAADSYYEYLEGILNSIDTELERRNEKGTTKIKEA